MVTQVPAFTPQELRTTEGHVFGYIIAAEDLDRLRAEVESLREQAARLQRQRDYYVAELTDVLKTHIPIPPTEEEMRAAEANPGDLSALIAELEAGGGPDVPGR